MSRELSFAEKIKTIGFIGKRTRPSIVEGAEHPESGLRYKSVTDELGHTVTEHSSRGATGTSSRQDVTINPKVVEKMG